MKLAAKYWAGLLVVLLLATGLGARKLDADGIWFDEWWSLYVAGADTFHVSRSVDAIWERISAEDIRQGVLYPYTLAAWGSAVGWTEFATRALSLFAGLVALAAVFRLGWALGKRPLVGLAAAAALGTSVWFVYFLHEMRVYMLLVMFAALLLLLYHRVMDWRRAPALRDYAALALVTGLLLNTHYFAGIFVGVVGVWHLARLVMACGRPGRRWWGASAAWLASGVMLIPWIVNLPAAAELARNEPRVQPDAALLLEIARDTFTAFGNASVALLALLLAFSLRARAARRVWLLLLLLLPLNLAAYYLFSLNELRYNMTVLPLLALLVGFGVDALAKRRVPAVLILSIWLAAGLALDGNFQIDRIIQRWPGQPIREMAAALDARVSPDDVIVNLLGDENRPTLALHPLVYYMGKFNARIEVVENSTYPGIDNFAARVREAVGDASRVWLVDDPRWTNTEWPLFEYLLNRQDLYHCETAADTAEMRVWGFGRIPADGAGWQYGDGIRLSTLGAPRVRDGLLQVWLGYRIAPQVPPGTYSVALHVLDAGGQLRAQQDVGLPAAGISCGAMEIPVGGLPPGDYTLHAAVYHWQTGERLVSAAPDGASRITRRSARSR
jgi:hypothetical protein